MSPTMIFLPGEGNLRRGLLGGGGGGLYVKRMSKYLAGEWGETGDSTHFT